MSELSNVTVVMQANIYFDGKVTSRTVRLSDGTTKTLGIMLPGEYEFDTAGKELIEIQSGELEVLLPGNAAWKLIKGGAAFEVPADSKFKLKVIVVADYCCSYLE
jgi:uncharacterized protein YaiE (UPF0345 family)